MVAESRYVGKLYRLLLICRVKAIFKVTLNNNSQTESIAVYSGEVTIKEAYPVSVGRKIVARQRL